MSRPEPVGSTPASRNRMGTAKSRTPKPMPPLKSGARGSRSMMGLPTTRVTAAPEDDGELPLLDLLARELPEVAAQVQAHGVVQGEGGQQEQAAQEQAAEVPEAQHQVAPGRPQCRQREAGRRGGWDCSTACRRRHVPAADRRITRMPAWRRWHWRRAGRRPGSPGRGDSQGVATKKTSKATATTAKLATAEKMLRRTAKRDPLPRVW
jgi:hypothetical protein